MSRTSIFRLANRLKDSVVYQGMGRQSLYFDVIEQNVEMRTELKGSQLFCTCKHCSLHPEALCMHKIAVILHYAEYLRKKDV